MHLDARLKGTGWAGITLKWNRARGVQGKGDTHNAPGCQAEGDWLGRDRIVFPCWQKFLAQETKKKTKRNRARGVKRKETRLSKLRKQ